MIQYAICYKYVLAYILNNYKEKPLNGYEFYNDISIMFGCGDELVKDIIKLIFDVDDEYFNNQFDLFKFSGEVPIFYNVFRGVNLTAIPISLFDYQSIPQCWRE